MRTVLIAGVLVGGLSMADGQDKKPGPEIKVTFKRTAKGEPVGKGDYPDVTAYKYDVKGEIRFDLVHDRFFNPPRGAQPGDTVVEADGTVWTVTKILDRGTLTRVVCVKAKDQPKKP